MTSTSSKPNRCLAVAAFVVLLLFVSVSASAQDRSFSLQGTTLRLQDLSSDADVFFQSMRFNRASNVWNVEVTVRNKGPRDLNGPVLLSVETAAGTSGLIAPDGIGDGSPGKPFYDLTALGQNGLLAPGQTTRPRTLTLAFTGGAPALTTKVFASRPNFSPLVLTRSINDAGVALGDVVVELAGTIDTNGLATETRSGLVTLPGTNATWRFSKTNHLSAWRTFNAGTNPVVYAPSPRLTPKSTNTVVIGVASGGTVVDQAGILVVYEPGSFNTEAPVTLTALTGQGLPGFLPLGWSPLQAFWLDVPLTQARPAMASVKPWSSIATNESAVVVRWSEELAGWVALQTLTGNGANVISLPVDRPGVYAVVVPDVSPLRPPTPAQGTLLTGVETNGLSMGSWSANGRMNPPSRAASRNPDLVTAQAELLFTNASGPLPSGFQFFCDITEVYLMRNGSRRLMPGRDGFFIAYQRGPLSSPGTLQASVPIRPSLLLAGDELSEAVLRIDVLTPDEFRGGVLATNGGQIAQGDLRVVAGLGSVDRDQAAIIRGVATTNFSELALGGFNLLDGFELGVGALGDGRRLALQGNVSLTNGLAVLARVLNEKGEYGLEPLERFSTDAAGKLTSLEPASSDRLSGLDGSGQFVLVGVQLPQVLLSGVARNVTSQPAEGLSMRSAGTPWLTFSRLNGLFRLLSPAGPSSVQLRSLATSDDGEASLTLTNGIAATGLDVALSGRGPRVVSIQPTNTATRVSRVASVSITFSRSMNPATLATGIGLFGTGGQAIPAAVSLNLAGTVATLQPAAQLAASTLHQVVLSTNLVDLQGRFIEGTLAFSFTTEAAVANRALAALTIYEPGSDGLVTVFGSPGTAEPEVPVILVNETTGRTATILSRPDGSFTNRIEGTAEDFVSAVVVNRNGTRVTVPASRQVFRDGSVGLFNGGGILEAQSEGGPQQLVVEPGAIESKTTFKVSPLSASQILSLTNDTPPLEGKVLGGMSLTQDGDGLKAAADVVFPFDPVAAGVTNPAKATYVLTIVREIEGEVFYEVIDKMEYVDGTLVTRSPPFVGALLEELRRRFQLARKVDKQSSKIQKLLGLPSIKDTAYNVLMLPLLMSQGTKIIVVGQTTSSAVDADGNPIIGTKRVEPGASVSLFSDAVGGRQGRLKPGATFTTSGSDGRYTLVFPINRLQENGFIVRATHPAFPFQTPIQPLTVPSIAQQFQAFSKILDAGLGGGGAAGLVAAMEAAPTAVITPQIAANLDFARGGSLGALGAADDAGPPSLGTTLLPAAPQTGTNANDGALVTVAALDDRNMANITLTLLENTPVSPLITNNPVTIVEEPGTRTNFTDRFMQVSFRVKSQFRSAVRVRAEATDSAGFIGEAVLLIDFGAAPRPIGGTNNGPRVLATSPLNGSTGIGPGLPLRLDFSRVLSTNAIGTLSNWFTLGGGTVVGAQLSSDGRSVEIQYTPTAQQISATVNSQLQDQSGAAFDQDPTTSGQQTFSMGFQLADQNSFGLAGIESGGGVRTKGAYAYALERSGPLDGALTVYDLRQNPPAKVGELSVPGFPRDLAIIPDWTFKIRTLDPAVTRDLVAVVGGKTGSETFQYLWVIDVSDPTKPVRLASAIISQAIAAVTKVQWAFPFLAYLESGADITSVSLVDLQAFIIGMNASSTDISGFPVDGQLGVDANRDGDFVDGGDTLPLPMRNPPEFFGKSIGFTDPDSTRRIEDFDFDSGSGIAAIVMGKGFERGSDGLPSSTVAPPAYRTLLKGLGEVDSTAGTIAFAEVLQPKRVAVFPQVLLGIGTNLLRRDLALVSLTGASNVLAVVDITDPVQPKALNFVSLDQLGVPQSLVRREDGLLALATQTDVVLIDPARLLLPGASSGFPPGVVGVVPGAGSGARSFSAEDTGVSVVNLGGKHSASFGAPTFKVVSFPGFPTTPNLLSGLEAGSLDAKFRAAQTPAVLRKTRLFQRVGTNQTSTAVTDPAAHYYVRVDLFGGDITNRTVPLVLESLNSFGKALRPGGSNAIPVRLASTNTLDQLGDTNHGLPYPRSIEARRLSDQPGSRYYNVFVAGPFVLSDTPMTGAEITQAESTLPRGILRPGRFLLVGLDPKASRGQYPASILGRVQNSQLVPGTSRVLPVENVVRPVVFIPGMAGSYLDDTNALTEITGERWPGFGRDARHSDLSLDPASTPKDIGATDVIRWIFRSPKLKSVYGEFLQYMTNSLGLVEYVYVDIAATDSLGKRIVNRDPRRALLAQMPNGPNLFVFPYDWRRGNELTARAFTDYLALIRVFNPEADKIDIVAHSMGGLVSRRIILDNPGLVEKCVTIGTPWLGAPKALAAMETGDFDELAMNLLVKKERLLQFGEFFHGLQQLLPTKAYFDIGGLPMVERGWDVNTNGNSGENYTYAAYKAAVDDVLHTNSVVSPVATNEAFHGFSTPLGAQDDWRSDATGVEYSHIYGVQAVPRTIGQVVAKVRLRPVQMPCNDLSIDLPWKPTDDRDRVLFSEESPFEGTDRFVLDRRFETVRVDGDGTVPALSASRLFNGNDFNAPDARLFPVVSPSADLDGLAEHNGMLANPKVQQLVGDILGGVAEGATPPNAPLMDGVVVTVSNIDKDSAELQDGGGEGSGADDVQDPSAAGAGQAVDPDDGNPSIIIKFLTRFIAWLFDDGLNPWVSQYTLVNSKSGNSSHTLTFESQGDKPYSVDVLRIQNGVPSKLTRWRAVAPEQSPATLKIDWTGQDTTLKKGETSIKPDLLVTGTAAGDTAPPAFTVNLLVENGSELQADDNAQLEVQVSDNSQLTNRLYLGFRGGAGSAYDELYRPIKTNLLQSAGTSAGSQTWKLKITDFEGSKASLLAEDPAGNVSVLTINTNTPQKSKADLCNRIAAEKTAVVGAIVSAVTAARNSVWMLPGGSSSGRPEGILYILEQGSGACFWVANACGQCDGIFTPDSSDHDYEVFLPVFSSFATSVGNVAQDPYAKANVIGDWYFKPPFTNAAGTLLVYRRPDGGPDITQPLPTNGPPKTPANFITEIMTDAAVASLNNASFKKVAENVSFFTAREEHFRAGYIDLERPLESGADPIGDGGAGRQMLLLKWVLEGEYVPGIGEGFRPDLDDVLARIIANGGINPIEGFEWGTFHEFAALGSGLMLQTSDPYGNARVEAPAHDFFYDVRKGHIKKAGKAAIRATLALMVANASSNVIVFPRSVYAAQNRSFEQYIAKQAAKTPQSVFGQFTHQDIDDFYKGKIADKAFMESLLKDKAKLDAYLAKAVRFTRYVQSQTAAVYTNRLNAMAGTDEFASRSDNLQKIMDGFPQAGKPGLTTLRKEASLDLKVRLFNEGPAAVSQVSITGTGVQGGTVTTNSFAADSIAVWNGVSKSNVAFYVKGTIPPSLSGNGSTTETKFLATGPSGFKEPIATNNWFGFHYYILNVDSGQVPSFTEITPPNPLPPTSDNCTIDVRFK